MFVCMCVLRASLQLEFMNLWCVIHGCSEESLHYLFSAHVAVKEIRMVLDKFTSAPRGFAFVHFHSVADASRMLNMFQASA